VRITARVPATSANLGPGFDCFGLALDLENEVTVDTDAEPVVSWEGEGADELPTDGTDMVSRAIAFAADRLREGSAVDLPAFSLHGVNRIPLERGLGSSAAAAVAGVNIANTLLYAGSITESPSGPDLVVEHAGAFEGHPDNVLAAMFGGLTVSLSGGYVRLDPHHDLNPVVLVPERDRVATADARGVLPASVDRADAVYNIGHAALASVALVGFPELLFSALRDRLHEDARAMLMPETATLLASLRDREIAACLSGAGPSIIAFPGRDQRLPDLSEGWRSISPGVNRRGMNLEIEVVER
jgi:homoserine kinase